KFASKRAASSGELRNRDTSCTATNSRGHPEHPTADPTLSRHITQALAALIQSPFRFTGEGGGTMLAAAALLSLSLAVNATYEPEDLSPKSSPRALSQMSPQQKFASLRPLVRSATDCVVRTIEADPRFSRSTAPADMNELIVASMAPCADAM